MILAFERGNRIRIGRVTQVRHAAQSLRCVLDNVCQLRQKGAQRPIHPSILGLGPFFSLQSLILGRLRLRFEVLCCVCANCNAVYSNFRVRARSDLSASLRGGEGEER